MPFSINSILKTPCKDANNYNKLLFIIQYSLLKLNFYISSINLKTAKILI